MSDRRAGTTRARLVRDSVLVTAMISTTFQLFVVGVLASRLIDDFELTRFQVGLVTSVNTAVGAITAPLTGRITDRLGARASLVAAQLIAAAGLAVMALAHSTLILFASAMILGIPQGWSNPATNAMIAERVAPGRRGVVTGIKQSGVQVSIILAGATLPPLADAIGWRNTIWIYAGIFAGVALLPLLMPRHVQPHETGNSTTNAVLIKTYNMRAVWFIALYAFLMGTAGGAISRFLALFAEEEAGMSSSMAGLVVALSGLGGIGTRILAARLAENRMSPLRLLAWLAAVGTGTAALLTITLDVGAWLLWPIALLFAIGHAAWNAVAMLAIIMGVPQSEAGRASGAVMFGFLGGLAVGAPAAGYAIDSADGSYQPVWIAAIVLAAAAAVVAELAERSASNPQA